jgi:hypothetical protein
MYGVRSVRPPLSPCRPTETFYDCDTENWSRDVTANIAIKLLEESQQGRFMSEAALKLIERITGEQFTVTA